MPMRALFLAVFTFSVAEVQWDKSTSCVSTWLGKTTGCKKGTRIGRTASQTAHSGAYRPPGSAFAGHLVEPGRSRLAGFEACIGI